MNNRRIRRWVFGCFVFLVATAEAQRGGESENNLICLPDAYDGEKEILISSSCQAAAVGGISAPQFFVTASRPYFIRGWNLLGGNFSAPVGEGAGGVIFQYEGFETFSQWQIGMVYAKKLSPNWTVGAGFAATRLRVAGDAGKSAFGYRLAVQYRPAAKLVLAGELGRPAVIPSVYQRHSYLPTAFRIEWWLQVSPVVQTFLLVQKTAFSQPSTAIVLKYLPHQKIAVRLGLDAPAASFWFGIGFRWQQWRIELNAGMHPYLGTTTGVGIGAQR